MKLIVGLFVCAATVFVEAGYNCKYSTPTVDAIYTPDIVQTCTDAVKVQINKEFSASMTYLYMGAHFSKDTVNLPGFAKFFFDSASEEREHGINLIKYLSMRGELTKEENFIEIPKPTSTEWLNGLKALEDALKLEDDVTKSIKHVIKTCELTNKDVKYSDYHISDWLTGVYLEEQYKSLRDLAGKLSTLKRLRNTQKEQQAKSLADFIFDKKLLGVEL